MTQNVLQLSGVLKLHKPYFQLISCFQQLLLISLDCILLSLYGLCFFHELQRLTSVDLLVPRCRRPSSGL